MKQNSEEVFK